MSDISTWSSVAANNAGSAPDFLAEACAPSAVNDAFRELQAAIRRFVEDAQWVNLGYTHVRLTASLFSISGDRRSIYEVGRRVKMIGSADAYGTISSSTFTSPNTTVSITEGNIPGTLSGVSVSVLSSTNSGVPSRISNGPTDFTAAGVRVSGAAVPTSGAGLELAYQAGIGYVTAYDYTAPGYTTLILRTGTLGAISNNGVTGLTLTESGGSVTVGLPAAPTSTSATGGSATALPSLPLGYLRVTINGTPTRIPYYAA